MESDVYQSEEKEIWESAVLQALFPGDLVIEIGRFFLGAPYHAGTLEAAGRERLVCNLVEFDCTTFVETVLALAQCVITGKLASSEFRKKVKFIRYRQGKIDGYASRLHYFTDWLRDNAKKKVLKDAARLLDGTPHRKKINFMTAHRQLYAGLRNETQFNRMRLVEKNLSRKAVYMIDKNKVAKKQSRIQQGDIIAFATDQDGLDVAHVGFAVRQGRHLHLLHASSKEGAVVISKETLLAYLKFNKKFIGIIIARFNDILH